MKLKRRLVRADLFERAHRHSHTHTHNRPFRIPVPLHRYAPRLLEQVKKNTAVQHRLLVFEGKQKGKEESIANHNRNHIFILVTRPASSSSSMTLAYPPRRFDSCSNFRGDDWADLRVAAKVVVAARMRSAPVLGLSRLILKLQIRIHITRLRLSRIQKHRRPHTLHGASRHNRRRGSVQSTLDVLSILQRDRRFALDSEARGGAIFIGREVERVVAGVRSAADEFVFDHPVRVDVHGLA